MCEYTSTNKIRHEKFWTLRLFTLKFIKLGKELEGISPGESKHFALGVTWYFETHWVSKYVQSTSLCLAPSQVSGQINEQDRQGAPSPSVGDG